MSNLRVRPAKIIRKAQVMKTRIKTEKVQSIYGPSSDDILINWLNDDIPFKISNS